MLEKNLQLMKDKDFTIEKFFQGIDFDSVEVLSSKKGALTAIVQSVLLHSRYDPEKEAQSFAQTAGVHAGDFVIVYGFGLGYHIEALLDVIGPQGSLYVIEPSRLILKTAFYYRDLSRCLQVSNLRIITGWTQEDMAYELECEVMPQTYTMPADEQKVLMHSPSFKCIPAYFDKIQNFFEVYMMERQIPATFQKIDKENLLHNLEAILCAPGIQKSLQPLAKKPCFIVGAGPSLNNTLGYLKQYQESSWICCVDTALELLLSCGIRPDVVISVDPQQDSVRHFVGSWHANVPLLFLPTAQAEVVQKYTAPKMVALLKGHS